MVTERKSLPNDFQAKLVLKPTKLKHKEAKLDVIGSSGKSYRLIVRQSTINEFDFSVILVFCPDQTNQQFRLYRCNGKSHEHTNRIERERFYGFHIHMATFRYQQLGAHEDDYAEPTDRYWDLASAISCIFGDCSLGAQETDQLTFLGEAQ